MEKRKIPNRFKYDHDIEIVLREPSGDDEETRETLKYPPPRTTS